MSVAVDSAVSFLLFVGRCSSPCRRAASIVNRLLVLVISCMHPMEKGRRNHSCSGTRVAIIHPKTSRIRMQPLGTFFLSLSNIFLSRTVTYLHLRSFLAANLLSEASGHAIWDSVERWTLSEAFDFLCAFGGWIQIWYYYQTKFIVCLQFTYWICHAKHSILATFFCGNRQHLFVQDVRGCFLPFSTSLYEICCIHHP